ncbi:hypothetical protein [Clostridium algoriphilum]|nr:hypothetical protein [Clostridium algoriphilum]
MLKLIIIAIIFTITYILVGSLMKAASKSTPVIPNIKHDSDKDN